MVGVLVIGTFLAVLGAELYFMYKLEEKKQDSKEHHCDCGHCHCKNEEE